MYTLGEWGALGDTIFTNWRVENIPPDAPGETRMGLDFGFAQDPCGFVRLRYDRKRRKIYVLEELYQKGLDTYQKTHGPLRRMDAVRDGRYVWTKGPWPWEYAANEEG